MVYGRNNYCQKNRNKYLIIQYEKLLKYKIQICKIEKLFGNILQNNLKSKHILMSK